MRLAREWCGLALLMWTACGVTSAGGGGGGSTVPRENTATTLTLSGTRFFVGYDNGTLAALPDGGVVLAALLADDKGYNADVAIVRLDASLSLTWAMRLDERTLPTHLVPGKDGALFVIAGDSYPGTLRVMRLDLGTGAVQQAVEFSNMAPGKALALDDGGLLVSGNNLLRLDARLQPVWARQIPSTHAVAVADGFIVAGVGYGDRARMTGVTLTKVSAEGAVAWQSFASPGPGNHSLTGVRTLADGSLMVGMGNDSTRGDSVAALSPFLITTFDAQGRLRKMSRARLSQEVPTSTGATRAPLQFGGGYSLVPMGQDTWMTFTANSGAFGSDVRAHVLARFAPDGSLQEALYGGLQATSGPEGSTLSFSLSGPTLTLRQIFSGGTGCVRTPTEAEFQPVEGKQEYAEGGAVQVTPITVTPKSITRVATALSANLESGCAVP
ncbi:hypothetical protein [Archangium primigenium]|uniref:hypothetical protein n=1 Tax=[Archangium] primigenium TaxID=2792470 RepID=UPI001956E565|nr:hypothetical protein [Archangium primigenium]MBM7116031.1 hypothetical protein [Archangium primigenium]